MIENTSFAEWAVLELMGHRRLAGYVTEQEVAGVAMLRIDIPSDPPTTQFYASHALYAITPTTEAIARAVAQHHQPQPVRPWELAPPRMDVIEHGIRVDPDAQFDVDLDDDGPPF